MARVDDFQKKLGALIEEFGDLEYSEIADVLEYEAGINKFKASVVS